MKWKKNVGKQILFLELSKNKKMGGGKNYMRSLHEKHCSKNVFKNQEHKYMFLLKIVLNVCAAPLTSAGLLSR